MAYRYVEKLHPFTLSPESLDWYLSKGWYRMGGNIFTTHFLCFQQRLYSAIWIRVDLTDFSFSKSQRKLLRKNAARFNTRVAYRRFTQEKEILYSRYAANFNGRLSPSLRDSLEDYDEQSVFTTFETCIRDKQTNELVAASYFDLGKHSVASIIGIYEPNMEQYSLGYYTMLQEMAFCQEQGFKYYYPGYIVPGYKRFDYKLRIGKCEYFELRTNEWRPFEEFDPEDGPVERQAKALEKLSNALQEAGYSSELCIYPLFEARLYHLWQAEYLSYPYVLLLNGKPESGKICLVAAFDPHESSYQLLEVQSLEELRYLFSEKYLQSFPDDGYIRSLLQLDALLLETDKLSDIVTEITNTITIWKPLSSSPAYAWWY